MKTRLQLTGDQITKLKEMARAETARLNEASAGNGEGESANARAQAEEKIGAIIGAEKVQINSLGSLVNGGARIRMITLRRHPRNRKLPTKLRTGR